MTHTKTPEVVGKQELVKRIAKQAGLSQKQTSEIFDATLNAIKERVRFSPGKEQAEAVLKP